MKPTEIQGRLNAENMRFAIVISRFNNIFTRQLVEGALDCLERHGADLAHTLVVWVPGANELPQAVERLAVQKRHEAILALGAVVQGATTHADLINSQVSRSLAHTAAVHGIPVINGVVAANSLEQAMERCGSKSGNKGWDAALAAIEMASVFVDLAAIPASTPA